MMKLVKGGISSTTSTYPNYFDIATFNETSQTGYIEQKGIGSWKLYISNAFVIPELRSEAGKHYFYGDFKSCLREAERLTGRNILIQDEDTLSIL